MCILNVYGIGVESHYTLCVQMGGIELLMFEQQIKQVESMCSIIEIISNRCTHIFYVIWDMHLHGNNVTNSKRNQMPFTLTLNHYVVCRPTCHVNIRRLTYFIIIINTFVIFVGWIDIASGSTVEYGTMTGYSCHCGSEFNNNSHHHTNTYRYISIIYINIYHSYYFTWIFRSTESFWLFESF